MKKICCMIIACLLIVSLFTGCGQVEYKAYVTGGTDMIFEYTDGEAGNFDESPIYSYSSFKNEDAVDTMKIEFMGKTYEGEYITSTYNMGADYAVDEYRDYENNVEFKTIINSEEVVEIWSTKLDKIVDEQYELNEESLKKAALDISSNFVKTGGHTIYEISTLVTYVSYDSNGRTNIRYKIFDYFASNEQAMNDGGEVLTYALKFFKPINSGIATTDDVIVNFNGEGYITSWGKNMTGRYDKYNNLKIDNEKVNEAIDKKVNELFADSDKYHLNRYELPDVKTLVIGKNSDELYLVGTVTLYLQDKSRQEEITDYVEIAVRVN